MPVSVGLGAAGPGGPISIVRHVVRPRQQILRVSRVHQLFLRGCGRASVAATVGIRAFHLSRRSSQDIVHTREPSLSTSQQVFTVSSLSSTASSTSQSHSHTSQEPPLKQSSRTSRFFLHVLLAAVALTTGFMATALPAAQVASAMIDPPTDEESLLMYDPAPDHPAAEINAHILSHPLTKQLQSDPYFVASRPHLKIPPTLRHQNFTGGTLLGDDKIPVPPLVFASPDGMRFVSMQYLGPALCGHPGIVHGGLLATLLDEGLARCCFPALPNKVGVTASLKIDYRKPCMAGQYVVLKAETTKVEGRKAWVKGRLEVLKENGSEGDVLVEAEALFVEPRQAASMAKVYSGSVGIKPEKQVNGAVTNGVKNERVVVNGATMPDGVQANGIAK